MNIKQLLEIAKITPNPALDQFFLTDDKILDEEVELAKLKSGDIVLEVGAGIGNLTIRLAKKSRVIAVEKDYGFTHILKNIKNTNALMGDALEFLESLRDMSKKGPPKHPTVAFNKIVSNIPYSISQPLLLEFFRHEWDLAVLIVQKEFADKLVSKERLGMMMSDIADVKIIKNIPANAFYPTAVASSLILVKQNKLIDDKFWTFLCSLKPNKNVSNQIKKFPKHIAAKKVHQLTLAELKDLYILNQKQ